MAKSKIKQENTLVSECHKAPITVMEWNGYGTMEARCDLCHAACFVIPKPVPKDT